MPRIKYFNPSTGLWEYADKIVGSTEAPKAVSFAEQILSEQQKTQARTNIDAISKEEANSIVEEALGSGIGDVLKSSDVVDNLTSTSTNKPLSANQGNILNSAINSVSSVANEGKNLGTSANTQAQTNKKDIANLRQDFEDFSSSFGENLEFAPKYLYGTEDLVAGSSALETGILYFVYE